MAYINKFSKNRRYALSCKKEDHCTTINTPAIKMTRHTYLIKNNHQLQFLSQFFCFLLFFTNILCFIKIFKTIFVSHSQWILFNGVNLDCMILDIFTSS